MMRLLSAAVITAILAGCQTAGPGPGSSGPDNNELTALLVFQQTLNQLSDAELAMAADQAGDLLRQGVEARTVIQLRLSMLESQLQLRELQQVHESQLQRIEALNAQIEALTAIEQQINRRGQLQESGNE